MRNFLTGRYIILALVIILGLTIVAFFILGKHEIKKIHYHAGFVVFENNKQVDFSDFKYMEVKPCNLDEGKNKEKEDEQIEKAHLHDQVGDIVHVERENSKWTDLFTNLHYDIDYKIATAYLNSKKVDNFQNLIIQPYDSLVVLIGTNDTKKTLSKAVKKSHIQETEKRSENCGT